MIIEDMRWGAQGYVPSCGGIPTPGSCNVEIKFADEHGEHFYLNLALYEGGNVFISKEPLFNILTSADFDESVMEYNVTCYEEGDLSIDEELADSPYRHVLRLARMAMREYNIEKTQEEADNFIAPYIGKDVDTLGLPVVSEYDNAYNKDE